MAFAAFYDVYDPAVQWAVHWRIVRWPEMIPHLDDVVQEVWVTLMANGAKRLRYYDPGRRIPFRKYLLVIVYRLAWRIAKRKFLKREESVVGDALDDSGLDSDFSMMLLRHDFLEKVAREAQVRLDERSRIVLEEHFVNGVGLSEIATRLGTSMQTMYVCRHRLMRKLRDVAVELSEEDSGRNTAVS